MKLNTATSTLLAAAALALVSVPIAQRALAQSDPNTQVPPRAEPRQGGGARPGQGMAPMQQPGMMMGPGMGGGGGAAMVADNAYLFIVQGGQVFKVRKDTLQIEKQTPLHQQPMMGVPARPGGQQPGSVPPRAGGGGSKESDGQ